jgi:hypothetical protein
MGASARTACTAQQGGVAIANKLARIAWAVLSSGRDYQHQRLQPAAA